YNRIGVDEFPEIDFPIISITTTMIGADPDIIDTTVTNVIETSVNSTPGIEHLTSRSAPGVSVVVVKFKLSRDVDVAFNEVLAKVNQALRDLPGEADPPVVAKVEIGAAPVMWLSLLGDRTLQQLNQYARNTIKKRLESIDGVGEIKLGGKRDRTIRVNLQPDAMAGLSITIGDVVRAFQTNHVQLPGGYLVSGLTENLIKLDLEFHNIQELANLIIAYRGGAAIRLKQIARVEDGLEDNRKLARFNDQPCVSIGIVKVSGANTVAIVEAVKERLTQEIIPQLPPGVRIEVASNDADFIEESIKSLMEHLWLGTLFAALVVFAFLKSIRSTIIITLAVPVSLLGAVMVMYFLGYTFNKMTMLALLLLIGVVVDDAIVVLENIFRFREDNPELIPPQAALAGTEQVVFAVLAATFSLVCIFAPVVFMEGIIGRFFTAFAVVVTVGVITSLFVSISLTPMLCSRFLVVKKKNGRIYVFWESIFQIMDRIYLTFLQFGLRFRWGTIVLTVIAVMMLMPLAGKLDKGFMPNEDKGRFLITLKTPLGSSIEYTNDRLAEVEKVLKSHPESIASYLSSIGTDITGQVSKGRISVRMTPLSERTIKQYDLIPVLRKELARIPGVQAFPSPVAVVGGRRGEPLQFNLTGPELGRVAEVSEALNKKLAAIPELGQVDLDLQLNLPQVKLVVDRTRIADLGLSALDVAMAVNAIVGGMDVAKYNDDPGDGERYDIRLKAAEGKITTLQDLRRIYLRAKSGDLIRLDTVAHLEKVLGPAVISRYDLQYSAEFFATPEVALGTAVEYVMTASEDLLPIGYAIKLTGRAEEFSKTIKYISFTFFMAIILVYMVLASQFNSFLQPLIIMVAQPLAIIGGIGGLWLFNHGLNIFSMVGLVLLMGLVAKNSILLVDLTNQFRAEGKSVYEALTTACPLRLRPVLMTSFTVILAMVPAALGYGAGADSNGPLAVAIIGGMISSTMLTLVVIPAVYSLVEGGIIKFKLWQIPSFPIRRKKQ
ncbi:MAG: efflux RND transporter permease subunit, partial [Candidatus Marinimicrobia bacterium]|nr:efflux RND transporter permease subunit [Candidatus Neomarinimicrobiota bacterium]